MSGSSSSSSFLGLVDVLPPENLSQIARFLPLADVLRLTSVSRHCLRSILPELYRRRQLLTQRPYWLRGTQISKYEKAITASQQGDDWIQVASVLERLQLLHDRFQGQPYIRQNLVAELIIELQEPIDLSGAASASFAVSFQLLKKILYVHQQLSKLGVSVFSHNPWESVALDMYMERVWTLVYLLDDNALVEGCKMKSEVAQLGPRYFPFDLWIYLHACILRRACSFTANQKQRLKWFHNNEDNNNAVDGYNNPLTSLVLPPFTCALECASDFWWGRFLFSYMSMFVRSFGPLGPAFRGRDNLVSHRVSSTNLFMLLNNDYPGIGQTRRAEAMEWICLVHEESRKSRPMTVEPPAMVLEENFDESESE
jgi:hypothetical protein